MAKHSIYLDSFHEILATHLAGSTTLSAVIAEGIELYFAEKWNTIDNDKWKALVEDLANQPILIPADKIPHYKLRESVQQWYKRKIVIQTKK